MGFWKEFREKRRVRKTFARAIRFVEKDPAKYIGLSQEIRHFQFIIVLLDDSQPDNVPEILSRVMDASFRHYAMISNISASIVVACLGVPHPDGDSVERRINLVNDLVSENGALIRVAHGQCNGKVGNLGCAQMWVYEAVIPGFNGILSRLLNSPAGTVIEVLP
jgi:hypothetical protein